MNAHTLLLFSATVLPLVCTPGPDILFVSSQAISGGTKAALRATAGVLLGYTVHSVLVAFGLAAVVAASPVLFEAIRWTGICYLVYLAHKLIRSALRSGSIDIRAQRVGHGLRKGFLTSLLNPKGMLMYVAILPQFMDHAGDATLQAALLSATFLFWCAVVYSAVSVGLGTVRASGVSARSRRLVDGGAGGMILLAAGFMVSA